MAADDLRALADRLRGATTVVERFAAADAIDRLLDERAAIEQAVTDAGGPAAVRSSAAWYARRPDHAVIAPILRAAAAGSVPAAARPVPEATDDRP